MLLLDVALILVTYCWIVKSEAVTDLEAVTVLYRHGDRVISRSYPNDPYNNESFWSAPYGELTNKGKRQLYTLGKWLRNRYNNFISEIYQAKEFYIRSSDYDRTLMSAAASLAGLYPPKGKQIWTPELNWQPIPIHTTPKKLDDMIAVGKSCPSYWKSQKDLLKSKKFEAINNSSTNLYNYLTTHSGKNISTVLDVKSLYDKLDIENYNNFTLPNWTKSVFPERMLPYYKIASSMKTYTTEMSRVAAGRLLYSIQEQFDSQLSSNPTKQKFQIYSGHDFDVFNVLSSLRIPNLTPVPFAGTIIFELRKKPNGQRFVQLWYKQGDDLVLMNISKCQCDCDYEKFKEILKPIAVSEEEWEDICK